MNHSWDQEAQRPYPWELLTDVGDELNVFGLVPARTIRDSLKIWLAKNPGMAIELERVEWRQYVARRTA